MNYYIADTHFGHKDIIRMDHRPFGDLQEMEEALVANWNAAAAVKNEDTVYILGDFCWGKPEEWVRLLRRLNGQKVLIKGNHDLREPPTQVKNCFMDWKPYKEIADGDRRVILSHYPLLFYKHSNSPNYYMLCGHVHTTPENDYLERFIAELREETQQEEGIHFRNRGQIYNVGAMTPWMAYTPRTLDEIIRRRTAWEEE